MENIDYFQVWKNSQGFPTYPLEPDFGTDQYREIYASLYDVVGSRWANIGSVINYKSMKSSFCLFPFDLTGDNKGFVDGVDHMPEFGSINFDIRFKRALPEVVSMIVYAEYEDTMLIDEFENVRCTWQG